MDALCMHALIREMQPVLRGVKINRVVQPDRWSLQLSFQRGRGPGGLILSVKPADPFIGVLPFPRVVPHATSRFTDLVLSRTKGTVVQGIEQLGLERIVALHLDGRAVSGAGVTLYAEMLGPRGDLVIVDRSSGHVIARLRSPSRPGSGRIAGPGEAYRPPPDRGRVDPRSVGEEEFCQLVAAGLAEGSEPARLLMGRFAGFSPIMAADLVARESLSGAAPATERAKSLWKPFAGLVSRVLRAEFEPTLLIGDDGEPIGLSAFPLITMPTDRQVAYATMSEAVAAYSAGREAVIARETLRGVLLRRLRSELARAERLSAKLEEEAILYQTPDLYARKGRLLLANREVIRRGERVVELVDHADPMQGVVQIELDPSCSLEDNAKRYFSLHRKAKRGAELVRGRLGEAERRLAKLQDLVRQAEAAKDLEESQQVEAAMGALVRRLPNRGRPGASASKPEGPSPRTFRSSDGLTILVGRSGPGNDHLTWRLARSHDLWLHAQGFSGSHVVVRLEKSKGVPPRTLREAAQIAAYYSRARGQVKVPVDYVLRKYLRKPKAAAPGLVLLSQEETIVVRPDSDLVRRLHPAAKTMQRGG
jgi:predicted ribosome quality control (RQC) complex YloA/Tae2 family protein